MGSATECRLHSKECFMDRKKYDAAYIRHVESGESAAVFVARDIVKSIDTTGKWIDVLDLDERKNRDGQRDFKYFTIELFPRKIQPKYPAKADEEDKKYITWQTAHEDIDRQRRQGYRGARFKICPKLVNRNKRKDNPKWDYAILSIKRL